MTAFALALALALALAPPLAPAALGHSLAAPDWCTCEENQRAAGWCGPCATGYVAGQEVRSATLFEAIDTHGHEVDVSSLECPGCKTAASRNDICATCDRGIVDGRIYASKLSYYLALGEAKNAAEIAAAAHEYELLRLALTDIDRCETCAVARYFGSLCPLCWVTYHDGEPVETTPPTRSRLRSGAAPRGERGMRASRVRSRSTGAETATM